MQGDMSNKEESDPGLQAVGAVSEGLVRLVVDARAELGEGAIWDSRINRLYWIDISGKRLFQFDPQQNKTRSWGVGQLIGTVVPRACGGLLLALQEGITAFDPLTGKMDLVARPAEYDSASFRFNDGKCDPAGRFWVGSYSILPTKQPGILYRMDPDRSIHPMVRGVGTSNGITWHRERKVMYFIDTSLLRVDAFDYDEASGSITNRRTVLTFPGGAGRPDGMAIDAEGMLWIAHWEGSRVTRWNPQTGECIQTIWIPALRVTSCAFGGPDLDRLYVTTARGKSPQEVLEQPHAGGLFVAHPKVRGLPAVPFSG